MINQNKNFVILGMHRSATSLVAKSLVDMGWHYGGYSISDHNNPWGYFEDHEILKINDEILDAAGGSWYDPPEEYKIIEQTYNYNVHISNFLEEKYKKNQPWIIKDPRLCLTFPVWEKHFDEIGAQLIFIWRDRSEVLKSLMARESDLLEGTYRDIISIYYERLADISRTYYNWKF